MSIQLQAVRDTGIMDHAEDAESGDIHFVELPTFPSLYCISQTTTAYDYAKPIHPQPIGLYCAMLDYPDRDLRWESTAAESKIQVL
jgi:hypothetical protein